MGKPYSAKPTLRKRSLLIFILLSMTTYGMIVAGTMVFPGGHLEVQLARAALNLFGVSALLMGSNWLLRRDGFQSDALGMSLSLPHLKGFLLGVLAGIVFMALLVAMLWIQLPFYFVPGSLSVAGALLATLGYFLGNVGEELIFRGYGLVVLAHFLGARKAAWVLALPFGLSHLPGLFGTQAWQMVATTSVMAVVFSYCFLSTGTLWTAISMHVVLNALLHTLTGLDGEAKPTLLKPVFHSPWPTGYNFGFWTFLGVALLTALLVSLRWKALSHARVSASSNTLG